MKISQEEIDAAWASVDDVWNTEAKHYVREMLKAAYRVRKARKKAKREAETLEQKEKLGFKTPKELYLSGLGAEINKTAVPPDAKQSMTEDEAALRKLGSAIAREFPGVSG